MDGAVAEGNFPPPGVVVPEASKPLPPPGFAATDNVVVRKAFPESWLWSNVTAE